MEIFSAEFFSALFAIIVIDLVLAGDNAIVIGLAARTVPKHQQRKVIFWGTAGAVIVRSVMTIIVVWLLNSEIIPGLYLGGGLLLIWIAYKLLVDDNEQEHNVAADSFWAAIRTVIVADAVMGLDNVLAVAGASGGSFVLVVLGLLISVPVVIWGSTIILKFIDRFPIIIYIGAGVLAWTAGKMLISEPMFGTFFTNNPVYKWSLEIGLVIVILVVGLLKNRKKPSPKAAKQKSAIHS